MIYIQRFSQQCPLYPAPLRCRPHPRVQSYRGLVPLVILCVLLTPCVGSRNSLLRCESVSACLRPPLPNSGSWGRNSWASVYLAVKWGSCLLYLHTHFTRRLLRAWASCRCWGTAVQCRQACGPLGRLPALWSVRRKASLAMVLAVLAGGRGAPALLWPSLPSSHSL